MTPVLRAERVTVEIARAPILDDISFSIAPGEWVSLVGPSGCGKTTLLHVLALLDVPTAGRVFVGDEPMSTWNISERARARAERIGLVFQDGNLLEHLTARENIALPVWLRDGSRDAAMRVADELLDRFELRDRAGTRASALSMGEAQRIAIARAIATRPSIVLLDEPTGSLDAAAGERVLEVLHDVSMRGATLFVVTHSREVAVRSTRTLIMSDGKLREGTLR